MSSGIFVFKLDVFVLFCCWCWFVESGLRKCFFRHDFWLYVFEHGFLMVHFKVLCILFYGCGFRGLIRTWFSNVALECASWAWFLKVVLESCFWPVFFEGVFSKGDFWKWFLNIVVGTWLANVVLSDSCWYFIWKVNKRKNNSTRTNKPDQLWTESGRFKRSQLSKHLWCICVRFMLWNP